MSNITKKSSFVLYIALTFLISWGAWYAAAATERLHVTGILSLHFKIQVHELIEWIGNFGPGLAALLSVLALGGRTTFWKFLVRCFGKRPNVLACLQAFLLSLVIPLTAYFYPQNRIQWDWGRAAWFAVLEILVNAGLAPLWEELGWRGYLLPLLLNKARAVPASFAVGLVWGFWHLPLRLHSGPSTSSPFGFFLAFCFYIFGLTTVFTWLYNQSRGTLYAAIMFHSAVNSMSHQFLEPLVSGAGSLPLFIIGFLIGAIGLALLLRTDQSKQTELPDNDFFDP